MNFVCDIHNHLPVKTYLYNEPCIFDVSLTEDNVPGFLFKLLKFYNPEVDVLRVLSTIPKMREGGVTSVIATHYVPENQFLSYVDPKYIKFVKGLAPLVFPELLERIESKSDPMNQTLESIAVLEDKVNRLRRKKFKISIPKNFTALEKAQANGDIILLHALEGAHHIGRNLTVAQIREAVRVLRTLGVCYITLAHFFDNTYAVPIEGLPPDIRAEYMTAAYRNRNRDADAAKGLTEAGKVLVKEMFDQGIIVDLTHTSPQGRRDVYAINNERAAAGKKMRPVVMSHVGVEAVFTQKEKGTDRYLCASDEDIDNINKCGGVIGVIFYNYWLAGVMETGKHDFGIEYIFKTMEYIRERTKTWDNVSIGTDFDGMTDTPDDYKDVSSLGRLKGYLGIHLKSSEVNAIMGENIKRVLKNGWGG